MVSKNRADYRVVTDGKLFRVQIRKGKIFKSWIDYHVVSNSTGNALGGYQPAIIDTFVSLENAEAFITKLSRPETKWTPVKRGNYYGTCI